MITPIFSVIKKGAWPVHTAGTFTLVIDDWDDYHFKTSYFLYYGNGKEAIEIGAVKIAPRGMVERDPHTTLPATFTHLDEPFYALGQDREYYEVLSSLPDEIGRVALSALRDVAADPSILGQVRGEKAFSTSFLRSVPLPTVTTQFQRIIKGLPPLTEYRFTYSGSAPAPSAPPLSLDFSVDPEVMPPTNVHVLIGSNGVGKSQLLKAFAAAAQGANGSGSFLNGTISTNSTKIVPFANVVHIAFSAFDRGDTAGSLSSPGEVKVYRVGLSDEDSTSLEDQFLKGLVICSHGRRRDRWVTAIDRLADSDPILADAGIRDIIRLGEQSLKTRAREIFASMSSGHKIVVLTVTRLVQHVEERSLILIDEPETHLHPPLLSALTRAISDLVIDRNGVAIVATHSPVVLQEVPRSCAWMLQRSGDDVRASKLPTETFGESVSRLTSEIFRLDVNRTGYTQVLRDLIHQHDGSAIDVLNRLNEQLGAEGRFVLSALANRRDGETNV